MRSNLSLSPSHQILLRALTHTECLPEYNDAEWELLIRLARKVKLLGRLALLLKENELWDKTPPRIVNQLASGLVQAEKLQQQAHWELNRILWALEDFEAPIIALKGIAYGLTGLPYSEGRLSVDLDLMVQRNDLADIETILLAQGWQHRALTAYDEHYYRIWSHEIPPLIHAERATEVDIHHTLAPLTSRLKIDTELLFTAATPTQDKRVKLLCPVDMVIHCAINLFQNNEIANDLRDLLDLHDLMVLFNDREPDFWTQLIERTNQLQLGYIIFYSLYFCEHIFNTPIPAGTANRLHTKPSSIKRRTMHWLVPPALFPQHPDKPTKSAALARLLLYLRSHIIRMPLYILLPHLAYKTVRIFFTRKKQPSEQK